MKYEIDIDVEDLGITTEDLISLAEDNGDRLYDEEELESRIEEAVADATEDAKDIIKSLEEESIKTDTTIANLEDLVKINEERVKLLEEENADLRIKSVDVEAIAIFVQTALRVEAIGIADCIRRGDYGA